MNAMYSQATGLETALGSLQTAAAKATSPRLSSASSVKTPPSKSASTPSPMRRSSPEWASYTSKYTWSE